jgi:hypothetical protein
MRLTVPVLSLVATAIQALPARSDTPATVDSGSYRIYRNDRVVGTESFAFETRGDSLIVTSHMLQTLLGSPSPDTLEKTMGMVVKAEDYDLWSYESHQTLRGQRIHRGLVMGDTALTSYFQLNEHGEGDRVVRPPGRIFVVDPQVFVLYDVICRNLHGKSFQQRPILLYALGARDTMEEATATDLGTETIRWAARPVQARKLKISDAVMEFYVWISPRGRMLRLSQPEYGLRVERAAAPIKRAERRR